MENLLQEFGEDLADKVKKEAIPFIDMKSNNSMTHRNLYRLIARNSSTYFISDKLDFAYSYTCTWAMLFDDQHWMKTYVAELKQRRLQYTPPPGRSVIRDPLMELDRLIDRRFHTLDMRKLLAAVSTNETLWMNVLNYISSEDFNKKHFLVIENLHDLYTDPKYESGYGQRAYDLFSLTRERLLAFIAPMTWEGYASRIERGPSFLIWRIKPILLSPRPSSIPPCPHPHIAPDKNSPYLDIFRE